MDAKQTPPIVRLWQVLRWVDAPKQGWSNIAQNQNGSGVPRRRDGRFHGSGHALTDNRFELRWSEDVPGDLAAGKIDVAIAADWWLRHAHKREPLLRDRYVGISANKKRFDLAAYVSAQHVLVAPHGRKPGVVDGALRKIGMRRKVTITVPDFASAARLVASGPMIATMPSRIALHYSKHYPLKIFELPLRLPELDISVASHPRAMSDPAIIWLMGEIQGVARRARHTKVRHSPE